MMRRDLEMCKNSNQFIYKAQCHRANQDCRKILGSNAQHFFWMTVRKRVINGAVKWKYILKNMGQSVISNHYLLFVLSVGNDTPESMADPWSTVPELRLNLCVYILCLVGGIVGNITVMLIMLRWVVNGNFRNL